MVMGLFQFLQGQFQGTGFVLEVRDSILGNGDDA
jgi:hypothetical protein